MRLQSFLNEGKMYVSPKDLPDWVKNILKEKYIGKDIVVHTVTDIRLGNNWHDANVRYIYLYEKGEIEHVAGTGEMGPWDSKSELLAKQGFKATLNQDRMILVTNTYPKSAELYVHPDAMIKALPKQEDDDLSIQEKACLIITRSLKSFARREQANRYNVDHDKYLPGLIEKGYLAKNKALTKKGKNYLLSNNLNDLHQLGLKKVGY